MSGTQPAMRLLTIESLRVSFPRQPKPLHAVDDATLSIDRGERVALVGESGSGKSLTALAILRLTEFVGATVDETGLLEFAGTDLLRASAEAMGRIRGRRIGLVFQDHHGALNPVRRIGSHIGEGLLLHGLVHTKREARERAVELLAKVGFPRPSQAVDLYPHELSGGMRQRVLIAAAIGLEPELLIADEPTTALDSVIQLQIMELLRDLIDDMGISILLISHDLRLVASFSERVNVMYAGRIVESGAAHDIFRTPQHPYTAALVGTMPSAAGRQFVLTDSAPTVGNRPTGCAFHPRCGRNDDLWCPAEAPPLSIVGRSHAVACHHPLATPSDKGSRSPLAAHESPPSHLAAGTDEVMLEVVGLTKEYRQGRKGTPNLAVDDVNFTVLRGETFGLVGESGSGKSTVARCVTRLVEPSAGRISLEGVELTPLRGRRLRAIRRGVQMVFQDPRASLDPRLAVNAIVSEPLRIFRLWGTPGYDIGFVTGLLQRVGLDGSALARYPHEFSGGELQRVALARALTLSPKLLVCDEPVSSLDASVAAQIIGLLEQLRAELGLTLLFISHDLAIVRELCDRTAVMQAGKIVEAETTRALFEAPAHSYTRTLLNAQLATPGREPLAGSPAEVR